ncbi:hypothetical protein SOVF_101050 [Spinacia oleracea]|nr:hypothetical protein SOVF_101050 [Spinacia oleracea]
MDQVSKQMVASPLAVEDLDSSTPPADLHLNKSSTTTSSTNLSLSFPSSSTQFSPSGSILSLSAGQNSYSLFSPNGSKASLEIDMHESIQPQKSTCMELNQLPITTYQRRPAELRKRKDCGQISVNIPEDPWEMNPPRTLNLFPTSPENACTTIRMQPATLEELKRSLTTLNSLKYQGEPFTPLRFNKPVDPYSPIPVGPRQHSTRKS